MPRPWPVGTQCFLQSFSRANAAAIHAGQGHGARVTRARARSMEDRCTGSAPSRLGHGSAARGMLGADGADFAARRERAERQSSSRHANVPTTRATSRTPALILGSNLTKLGAKMTQIRKFCVLSRGWWAYCLFMDLIVRSCLFMELIVCLLLLFNRTNTNLS